MINSTLENTSQNHSDYFSLENIIIVILLIAIFWFVINKKSENFNNLQTYAPPIQKNMPIQRPVVDQYYSNKIHYTDVNAPNSNNPQKIVTFNFDNATNDVPVSPNYSSEPSTNCNLLGLSEEQQQTAQLYSHQINCPKKCSMDKDGMNKNCIVTNDSCNDANRINNYILQQNNNKSCATCTNNKSVNNLNRIDFTNNLYNNLPEDVIKVDQERALHQDIANANVSNFVNFENNVYQNSVGETSVDRMAEIRTSTGTCGLRSYGKSIAQVYDNLVDIPTYQNRDSNNVDNISGIFENASFTDDFESL